MSEIVMIGVNHLYPHPDNPRKDVGDITELADSLKANGVLQNLTVVPKLKENNGDDYTVVIGHRRLAAAKQAGLTELPCVVAEMTPQEQLKTMLMENMQRSDLTNIEQAQGFQLMLDMGETVESISRDSGFSQTTIRRRLKLVELDQEKLRKAEKRGATLSDYMELDKIEDPELKNKVLDAIGTADFHNELKKAISAEKLKKRLKEWEEQISLFATIIETKGEVNGEKVPMDYVAWYSKWNLDQEIQVPDDFNSVQYYYKIEENGIYIYAEHKEKQKTADEIKREERETASRRIRAELEEITERHFNLRNEFISELSSATAKKYFAEIAGNATWWIIGDGSFRRFEPNVDALALAFDIDLDENAGYDDLRKALDPLVREQPEKGMLSVIYSMIDDSGNGFWESRWNREKGAYEYVYKPNDELDRLYVLLGKLGYEASDEEAEMMNGTHELLQPTEDK